MTAIVQTVLILDDDDAVRESLLYYFEDLGWDARGAGTAEEALEVVQEANPAGVVVDIRLPGMDGNSFIVELEKTHPHVACLICTGSPEYQPPDHILTRPQVFGRIFTKPVIDLGHLAESMRQHIINCNEKAIHGT